MAFNPEQVFQDMLSVATGKVQAEAPQVQAYVTRVLNNHKKALTKLGEQRVAGQIDDNDLKDELDAERESLEAELQGARTIAAKVAQDAANAAIDVLTKAVTAALKV